MYKKYYRYIYFFLALFVFSNCKVKEKDVVKKGGDFGGMVLIPAGEFVFGSGDLGDLSPFISPQIESEDAKPSKKIFLEAFAIDKYEVGYDQFLRFSPEFAYRGGKYGYPVTGITWYQAEAFCRFAKKRLPSEEEWEKAARGKDGWRYPWGNDFDPEKLNVSKELLPLGSFKTDVSPFGVYDLGGNVSEWTASWYQPYAGSQYRSENFGEKFKVARGGSFSNTDHNFLQAFYQATYRHVIPPDRGTLDVGFRCVQ